MHFCVTGLVSCGGSGFLFVVVEVWMSENVARTCRLFDLERMRAQYERGRGLYALWVERCLAYGFSYIYGFTIDNRDT